MVTRVFTKDDETSMNTMSSLNARFLEYKYSQEMDTTSAQSIGGGADLDIRGTLIYGARTTGMYVDDSILTHPVVRANTSAVEEYLDGFCVKSGEGRAARVDEFNFGSSPGASPSFGACTTMEMQLDQANDDPVGVMPPTNEGAGFGSADQPEN